MQLNQYFLPTLVDRSSATPHLLADGLNKAGIFRLLNSIYAYIDRFFNKLPGQLVPDSFNLNYWESKPLKSRLKEKAYLELDRYKLGVFDEDTKRKRKGIDQLLQDYANIQQSLKHRVEIFVQSWFAQNPEEWIALERLETIKQLFDIFLDTQQISESTILWITKFALVATGSNLHCHEEFYLAVSLAGDAVVPPYIEAYLVQPLSVLSQLQQLKLEGKIKLIPKLAIIFTYHSQAVENLRDKAGDRINYNLHLHNSKITLERVDYFIKTFFSSIADFCNIVEFPAYSKYSLARLFFAVIWHKIPIPPETLALLFAIKGNVQDDMEDCQDLIKVCLGNANPYVSRHIFTNMNLSNANTLRFGSDRTETPFHLAATSLSSVLRQEETAIREAVKLSRLQLIQIFQSQASKQKNSPDDLMREDSFLLDEFMVELLLNKQLSSLPPLVKIHAQIGMHNTHACYYKHPEEPSLEEIIASGDYSAQRLREQNRADKAMKMEQTFAKTAEAVGKQIYLEFLSQWCDRYLPKSVSETQVSEKLYDQTERVVSLIMPIYETRQLLNYWLP